MAIDYNKAYLTGADGQEFQVLRIVNSYSVTNDDGSETLINEYGDWDEGATSNELMNAYAPDPAPPSEDPS
jgi:hypothetical protein